MGLVNHGQPQHPACFCSIVSGQLLSLTEDYHGIFELILELHSGFLVIPRDFAEFEEHSGWICEI